jgi:drug/metabolite transporter (DMT)-like permease
MEMVMSKRARANIMLFITAFIWGSAFVAQKVGADIGTFTYNGIRTFVGGITLIPVILIMNSMRKKKNPVDNRTTQERQQERRMWFIGGLCCGFVLFVASTLQQYGIYFTTAGNAGFITALYCIIVPFMSLLVGKKIRWIIWPAVVLGVAGLYLLCINPEEGLHLQKGDFFVLLCAFAFACHIMVIDYFSPKTDGVKLSTLALFTRTILGKYTIETMVPAYIVMMTMLGTMGLTGTIVLLLLLVLQIGLVIVTKTNSAIHDVLAATVAVDIASQMIFDSEEAMIAYKKKIHAQQAEHSPY